MSDTRSGEPAREHHFPPNTHLIDTAAEDLLSGCRTAYDLGYDLVLYDLICLCDEHNYPVPDWAIKPLGQLMKSSLMGTLSDKAGRTASPQSKILEEAKLFARWYVMRTVLLNHDNEISKNKASQIATKALKGTVAGYAEPRAIQRSYNAIEMRIKKTGVDRVEAVAETVERTADRLGLLNLPKPIGSPEGAKEVN